MLLILDFGGQYAHLIASRIRKFHIYTEILPPETPVEKFRALQPHGIILSGGPQSVYDKKAPKLDPKILNLGVPVLGICYGHQLLAHTLGGTVKSGETKEYGPTTLNLLSPQLSYEIKSSTISAINREIYSAGAALLNGLPKNTRVWMSHGDEVVKLPKGFITLASTANCQNAAVADPARKIFGVQFHPEVTHTEHGAKILKNFTEICRAPKNWSLVKFLQKEIEAVRAQVGEKKVFLLVSGGVDSTVAFALLEKALGKKRVFGLFVDTGFSRLNEVGEVRTALKKLNFDLHIENAAPKFFAALKGVTDPEEKRAIIGKTFLEVQKSVVKKLKLNPDEWFLGQGTIYPDTIETGGTKHADKIKTHHNRVPEIEALIRAGRVVEPLKQLYKDEVRALGEKLKLPRSLVWRHPFPGPGLAVRCLCAKKQGLVTKDLTPHLGGGGIDSFLSSYPTSHIPHPTFKILPLKSVGVQGDARTYRQPLALFGKFTSWEQFDQLATELTNRFAEINRVLLCLSHETPPNFQTFPATLTPERIKLLQNADAAVTKILRAEKLYGKVWQFPVVLVPLSPQPVLTPQFTGGDKRPTNRTESVILRPVNSAEAMTANFARLPWKIVQKMTQALLKIRGVGAVFYDLTNKPPGTIEWE